MVDWTEVIIAGVGILFTAVIAPLVAAGFAWLRGKTKNEALKAAIDEAHTVVYTVVSSLNQTLVDGLKAKAADGKLTADEAAMVLETAVDMFMSDVSNRTLNLIANNVDDVEAYVRNLIEAKIAQRKW